MCVARRLCSVVLLALLPGLSGCPFGGVTRLNRVTEAIELSELRLFLFDEQWFLKQRLTYPRSCAVESERRIAGLLPRLPWSVAE